MTNTYEAGFNGKTTTLQANDLWGAKKAAVAHFKPRRSQEHMVWVVVKAVGDRPVSLFNSNADLG